MTRTFRFWKFLPVLLALNAQADLVELRDVQELRAGVSHACAVVRGLGFDENPRLYCWGGNLRGQLGDGTHLARPYAVRVGGAQGFAPTIGTLATAQGGTDNGQAHTCAGTLDGAKCWGANDFGQLGDGTTIERVLPVDVVGLPSRPVGLAAGASHTCAVMESGALMCWGDNSRGQLGDGTTTSRATPALVTGMASGVAKVAAGAWHTCAILSGGALQCWGANEAGQLGDGTTADRLVPTSVASLPSGVASATVSGSTRVFNSGGGFSCALTVAGGAKCWGANESGQLGEGTGSGHFTPFDVTGLTSGVVDISTAGIRKRGVFPDDGTITGGTAIGHTCAVLSSGRAKCWGINYAGMLGSGVPPGGEYWMYGGSATPIDVVGLPQAAQISAGGTFTCSRSVAKKANCWGSILAQPIPASVLVGTAAQRITFAPQSPLPVGATRSLNATGGLSGNPITFSSLTPSTCSVTGSSVTGLANGICQVAANQAGSDAFEAAPQQTTSFRVGDAMPQTITFGSPPSVRVAAVGIVSASATSGLPVTFHSNTPSICTTQGSVVQGVSVGTCTIAADQGGDALWAPAPETTQSFAVSANAGAYGLTVVKTGAGQGTVVSSPGGIDCGSICGMNVGAGATVTLTANAASGSSFAGWSGACSGQSTQCQVVMSDARSVQARFIRLPARSRLVNISTRAKTFPGQDVSIAGFIIGGTTPKKIAVRALGPSLMQDGVTNVLDDPTMRLYRTGQENNGPVASNDDWASAASTGVLAPIQVAGLEPEGAAEAAAVATLSPGAYTTIIDGKNGASGNMLVEVFEVDSPDNPLLNISTRARVLTGNDVMIAGFIIAGEAPLTVVIRARGPSLRNAGITDPLGDPVLELHSGASVIAQNDNWLEAGNSRDISTLGYAPDHPNEAAILITLNPGPYTAVVTGKNGTTGVGIVEVFAVQ
jgi:hypothetical protein